MNTIDAYFNAEKTGGLMFITLAVVAIGVAAWTWRYGAFCRGAAWPLVLVALLQLGVGGTVWWRSPQNLARVQHIIANERTRLGSEEIPRMQSVVKEFARNQWVELALMAAGILIVLLAPCGTAWQGAGAGLAVQAGWVIFLDWFAARRAADYLSWLQSL
jgi:hypothetical protein